MPVIVHIEHRVHDYARWKAAFDEEVTESVTV